MNRKFTDQEIWEIANLLLDDIKDTMAETPSERNYDYVIKMLENIQTLLKSKDTEGDDQILKSGSREIKAWVIDLGKRGTKN